MTIFKRSIQSLRSLKKRTIILGILFFLVSIFLVSGSVIKSSLQNMLDSAKKEVNPIATIETDLDSLMKDMMSGGKNSTSKPIDDKLVEKIKSSKYVKDFSVYGAADVSTQYSDNSQKNSNVSNDYIEPTNTIEILDSPNSSTSRAKSELVDGRYVKENEDNKIIVSEKYANQNNLKVGDTLDLLTDFGLYNTDKTKVEIVGIYRLSEKNNSDVQKNLEEKTFYSNRKLVSSIKKVQFQGDTSSNLANYSKIKVNLKNPMDTEKFFKEIKNGEDYEGIKFSSSYDQYKSMSGIVDSMSNIFSVIQAIVFVVSGVIVALIMLISLRERKYEIGLLRSLGESRLNVIVQMFLEVFIIFAFSFLIGFGISKYAVTPNITTVINEQLDQSISDNSSESQLPFKGPNFEEDTDSTLKANHKLTSKNSSVTMSTVLVIFSALSLVVFFTTTLPTLNVVKKSPKSILSSKE
ncbi:ABC transporter permease [Enterococcus faecalis]|nr:ABC transporter permease [Enterococcus faecalis]